MLMTANQDRTGPDTYVATDLVVDLAQLDLVLTELAGQQITAGRVEPSDELGLALLGDLQGDFDLDALLAQLRSGFEGRFGGWTPVLGKNRHLAGQPMAASAPPDAGFTAVTAIPPDLRPMISIEATASGGKFRVCGPGAGRVMTGPGDGPGSGKVMDAPDPTYGGGGVAMTTGGGAGKVMSGAAAAMTTGGGAGKVMEPAAPGTSGGGAGKVMVVTGSWTAAGFAVNPPVFFTAPSDAVDADGNPLVTRVGVLATASDAPGHAALIAQHAPAAQFDVRTVEASQNGVTAWQVANAMVGFEVDVLHLPFTCRTLDGKPPLVLARAVGRLRGSVVIVTGAAAEPSWPAALPGVVAVGEHDSPWVSVPAPDAAAVSGQIAARTAPGVKSARQALEELLSAGLGVVGASR